MPEWSAKTGVLKKGLKKRGGFNHCSMPFNNFYICLTQRWKLSQNLKRQMTNDRIDKAMFLTEHSDHINEDIVWRVFRCSCEVWFKETIKNICEEKDNLFGDGIERIIKNKVL